MKLKFIPLLALGLALIFSASASATQTNPQAGLKPYNLRHLKSQWKTWENPTSEKFAQVSFKYPRTYLVSEGGLSENTNILTVQKGELGKIEIFQMKNIGAERPWGVEPEEFEGMTENQIEDQMWSYAPKKTWTISLEDEYYEVWLYTLKDDKQTLRELEKIAKGILLDGRKVQRTEHKL